jgi:hypothetical protein
MLDESEGDSDHQSMQLSDYEPQSDSSDTDNELPTTHSRANGTRGPLKFLEEMARFHRYWEHKNQMVGLSRRDSIDCEIKQAFRAIRHAALIEEMRPHVYILYKLLDRCFYQLKRNRRGSHTPNLCQRYLAQMAVEWPTYKHQPKYKLVAISQEELDSKTYDEITLLIEGDSRFRTKLLNKMKRFAVDVEAAVLLEDDLSKELIPVKIPQPLDPLITATAEMLIQQIFAKEVGAQDNADLQINGAGNNSDDAELHEGMAQLAADYPEFRLWASPRVRRVEAADAPNNGQVVQNAITQLSFQAEIANSTVMLPHINEQFAAATALDNQMYIVTKAQLAKWVRCEQKLHAMGCMIVEP